MLGNVLEQLKHRSHLALGEQIDLQVEMTPLVRLACQPVLAGESKQLGRPPRGKPSSSGTETERIKETDPTDRTAFTVTQAPNQTTRSMRTGPLPAVQAIQSLTGSSFERASRIALSHR
jgi:hypothetical protein